MYPGVGGGGADLLGTGFTGHVHDLCSQLQISDPVRSAKNQLLAQFSGGALHVGSRRYTLDLLTCNIDHLCFGYHELGYYYYDIFPRLLLGYSIFP